MDQQETLYAVVIQRHDAPSKPRLLWDGFQRPYLTAFRSEAVKEKRAAVESGWPKARVVKVLAKFTWLALLFVQGSKFDVQGSTVPKSSVQGSRFDVQGSTVPQIPDSVVQPPRLHHFAATATANGLESDYSTEVTTTNPRPTLAWDPVHGTGLTYRIHRGTNAGSYQSTWPAGTACVFQVPALPLPTNRILTLTTLNATGLQYRPWGGTWFYAGRTNLTLTNPPVGLQYRPLGRPSRPARAYITITHQ